MATKSPEISSLFSEKPGKEIMTAVTRCMLVIVSMAMLVIVSMAMLFMTSVVLNFFSVCCFLSIFRRGYRRDEYTVPQGWIQNTEGINRDYLRDEYRVPQGWIKSTTGMNTSSMTISDRSFGVVFYCMALYDKSG